MVGGDNTINNGGGNSSNNNNGGNGGDDGRLFNYNASNNGNGSGHYGPRNIDNSPSWMTTTHNNGSQENDNPKY